MAQNSNAGPILTVCLLSVLIEFSILIPRVVAKELVDRIHVQQADSRLSLDLERVFVCNSCGRRVSRKSSCDTTSLGGVEGVARKTDPAVEPGFSRGGFSG